MVDKGKSFLTNNGLGVVQLVLLAAIFYITTVAGESSRKEVMEHARSDGHPTLVAKINAGTLDRQVLHSEIDTNKEISSLIQKNNTKQYEALQKSIQGNTELIKEVIRKLPDGEGD